MPSMTLAQSFEPHMEFWFYLLLLIGCVLVGGAIIFAIRRSLFSDETPVNPAGGGLLEHLDEMKRAGHITKEEYDTTRASIIGRASEQLNESAEEDTPECE